MLTIELDERAQAGADLDAAAGPRWHFNIEGAPVTKKNQLQVTWPLLMRATRCRSMSQALKLIKRLPQPRVGPFVDKVLGAMATAIQPSAKYKRWETQAVDVLRAQAPSRDPIAPAGVLLGCDAVFYVEQGASQRFDLVNAEQAVWDALTKAGVIVDDYWINAHPGSRRSWARPFEPGVEIDLWVIGPKPDFEIPSVRLKGLTAALRRDPHALQLEIVHPTGTRVMHRIKTTKTRNDILRQAHDALRRNRPALRLEGGVVIEIT